MANLSDYTENLIATWLAGGQAPAALTTVFLEIYSTLPNEDGTGGTSVMTALTGSATRKSLNNTNFTVTGNLVKNNLIELTPNAGACNIGGFAVWTLASGGNMLYRGSLLVNNAQVAIGAGDTVRFDANAIVLTVD
jgi:hypothetical protein